MILWAILLAASPGQVKLASPGLSAVNLDKQVATFYSDHLAQQLALQGVAVLTSTDVGALVGLERQRQLMGCSTEASAACTAELANALGVDAMITGSIGKLGTRYQMDIKIISAKDGSNLALHLGSVDSEREVLEGLNSAAQVLYQQLMARLRPSTAVGASASGGARRFWWAPAVVGGLAVVTGGILMVLTGNSERAIRNANTYDEATRALQAGNLQQTLAGVAFGVGGAALVAAGLLYLLGAPATVTAAVTERGGALAVALRWP